MSICVIKGPAQSGKSLIARALRNNQISNKKGALLIDEDQNGELNIQLEKIIAGDNFNTKTWKSLPWKPDAMIITVGDKDKVLDEFEAMMPGFKEFFGPVYTVNTGV